jgi:hypothetical protein
MSRVIKAQALAYRAQHSFLRRTGKQERAKQVPKLLRQATDEQQMV